MDKIIDLGILDINLDDCNEFSEEVFQKFLPLSREYGEVNLLTDRPLVRRRSDSICFARTNLPADKLISRAMFTVTFAIIYWLKEELKIGGDVILYYKQRIQHLDSDIECAAFQRGQL